MTSMLAVKSTKANEIKEFPYEVLSLLGQGATGKVYRCRHLLTGQHYALKATRQEDAVTTEMEILARLQLSIHVIRLHEAFVYDGVMCMVYELMDNTPFLHDLSPRMTGTRSMLLPFYMRQMLKGVSHIHKHHIIHFDIKPGNLVRDRHRQLLKWIDFASSVQYVPGDENSPDVGTVAYRAPEMLFKSTRLTYAVDVWAIGCMFLQMLYPEHAWVFFSAVHGHSVAEQIDKVCGKFGSDAVHEFCSRYELTCFKFSESVSRSGVSWSALLGVDEEAEERMDPAGNNRTSGALDLLDKLLSLDPVNRPTAEEALNHPYLGTQ